MPTITSTFNTPTAITDEDATDAIILINSAPANAVITKITITNLNLTHTFDADLDISLFDPNYNMIDLSSDNGGSADNYTNTSFDDAAGTLITSGLAPFTGTFRPETALSTLYAGNAVNGVWTLRVFDDAPGDTGVFNSWTINITYAILPIVWNAGSGNWFTAANWNAPIVPTAADTAILSTQSVTTSIAAGGAVADTINVTQGATLAVNAGGGLNVGNAINIGGGANFT